MRHPDIQGPKRPFRSFARRGSASLHAGGRAATAALLQHLPDGGSGQVLELGCGTGETSIQLARRSKGFVATDPSMPMLNCAKGRSKWCGVSRRIAFVQISDAGDLPFPTRVFDAIVIESVLAIQPPVALKHLIDECRRIIRPSGRLLVNETVWRSITPRSLAQSINTWAIQQAGIIQATTNPFNAQDWADLFEHSGFEVNQMFRVDDPPPVPAADWRQRTTMIASRLFTLGRRLSAGLPSSTGLDRFPDTDPTPQLELNEPVMEGVVFVLGA